jgi:hypothetical protein
MKIESDICAIAHCNEPRRLIRHTGRTSWRSSLCPKHHTERERARTRPEQLLPNPPPVDAPLSLSVADVYANWSRDRALGVVSYQGRRVYGLKQIDTCYRALVAGMEYVLLSERTTLTLEGHE